MEIANSKEALSEILYEKKKTRKILSSSTEKIVIIKFVDSLTLHIIQILYLIHIYKEIIDLNH